MSKIKEHTDSKPAWAIRPAQVAQFELPEAVLDERPGFAWLRLRFQSSGPLPPLDVDALLTDAAMRSLDGNTALTPPETKQAVVDARNTLAEELTQRKHDLYDQLNQVGGGLLGELAEVLLTESRLARRDLDYSALQLQRRLAEVRAEPAGATV